MKFNCLACGKETEETSRCMNCGVVYKNKEPQVPIRDYIENGRVEEQMEGLNDLLNFLKKNNINPGKMVEIGVWLGASTIPFVEYFEKIDCIDHWHGDKNTPSVFIGCEYNFRKHKNIEMIRKFSGDAHLEYEDESIDFIYIDGDHRYEFVKNDIANWYPKLKKGGVMAGHDYGRGNEIGIFDFTGLTMAVDEHFNKPDIVFCDTSWAVIKK